MQVEIEQLRKGQIENEKGHLNKVMLLEQSLHEALAVIEQDKQLREETIALKAALLEERMSFEKKSRYMSTASFFYSRHHKFASPELQKIKSCPAMRVSTKVI